jgi:hypothetical protein
MLVFLLGLTLVIITLTSAIRTFVLPRSAQDSFSRAIFILSRRLFQLRLKKVKDYLEKDRIMGYYAPVSLLMLVPFWYAMILAGYAAMFWALGAATPYQALRDSGSSLLTLGFEPVTTLALSMLAFSEALLGLMLVALLIAYLPTMYAAFSRRESAVTLLEVRAGNPPSAVEMIKRYSRIHGLERLGGEWETWEKWFADIGESHTSLPALVFFRSPRPEQSWITAAGAILDAASITLSAVDTPYDPRAALCIRAGYLALQSIAGYFNIQYRTAPRPTDPIRITRDEFNAALDDLQRNGVALFTDRNQAWRDFNGWRVNYDDPLLALVGLTMAPTAPWSGDRPLRFRAPANIFKPETTTQEP